MWKYWRGGENSEQLKFEWEGATTESINSVSNWIAVLYRDIIASAMQGDEYLLLQPHEISLLMLKAVAPFFAILAFVWAVHRHSYPP